MNKVDSFLREMIESRASDLHLASGCVPMIRLHGELEPMSLPVLEAAQVRSMVLEILSPTAQDTLFDDANVDFVYSMESPAQRFRGNAFFQKNGLNLVFRAIAGQIPSLRELGLPDILTQLVHHHHGLALVVGPAGCGKTSTLAALIAHINDTRATHIITVEDPIEYVFENRRALVVQRQVGRDVDSFATALRAALREDPDVVVVGEMRDLDTIAMAISAAETGHLVLGTLHTRSSVQTVQRIIDSFPSGQQSQIRTMLSESLRGVFCQQLVPKANGSGRVAAYELLMVNPSVANLIREGKDFQLPNVMAMGRSKGMRMMDDSLMELYQKGVITADMAEERCNDPKTFAEQLKNAAHAA